MGRLSQAKPIEQHQQGSLWTIYGKSGSGKTALAGTFPKPILDIIIGDNGAGTIKDVDGIEFIEAENIADIKSILKELETDKKYKTVLLDTFGLIVNSWIDENAIKKSKRMSQQMWGDLKNDIDDILRICQSLAKKKNVILTVHEILETIEGLEEEIIPDARPNMNKGTRTYLEGLSNYGIHTTKIMKTVVASDGTEKEVPKYAAHIGANPFYWTKLQVNPAIKLPKLLYNPTYEKIMKLAEGEK